RAVLQLQACDDRVCRVRYSESGKLTDPAVTAIVGKLPAAPFQLLETNSYVGLKTKSIEARVDRETGAVSFVDTNTGKTFLAEAMDSRASITTHVEGQTVHGPSLTFIRQPGEAAIGLGQHQEGKFNYTDTRVVLLQKNTEIGVPVLTSSAGYTLLWDNPSVTTVDASKSAIKWSSEYGENIDYYICFGPDLNQAIAGYRKLTGDAPMFGRWAWGLWQSRERYVRQEDLLSIAREYRKRRIPIDGIVQDWQYWFPQPWGSHAFGTNFPDPAGLMKELHDTNFHAIISVWAKFDRGSKNYDEMESAGNLYPPIYPNVAPAGKAKWYDAFKPEARAMYWRQMNEQIGIYGWDGWWLDATEPELGGKWGELRNLPTAAGPGYAVFNAYPLMTTTAVYEGQKARKPEVRPLILTRSAYAGQQRNGAIAWSGDIRGSWDVFRKQIPAGLNFVATGIPYWNTDTGGFFGGDPNDPDYRELFTRWFQFSTFCPMLRVHGTGPHKALWLFGEETFKTLLTFDKLRYRLLPYIYSTSWQVTSSRASMMRPLLIDYPTDPKTHDIGDQFLFGPGIMACPVTQSVGGSLAVIPSTSLLNADGQPGGLSAVYYQGKNFEKEVARRVDPVIDFAWDKVKREGVGANPRTDPIPGLNMDGFSVRWQGFIQAARAGAYTIRLRADDGMRMWIDGNLVVDDWNERPSLIKAVKVDLPADKQVPIKVEYFQGVRQAEVDLRWQPPADDAKKVFTRKVYLPLGTWFDFWTGQSLAGGKTIDAEAPVERLPLFVKAGTILPMAPAMQYVGEQPHAPLEVRVYRGADGSFLLYDDAGDGYGYEKGEYATIPFTWNEQAHSLTIGIRVGRYPGMPANRQFRVVMVKPSHGVGPEDVSDADHAVDYDGSALVVKMAP
ncbi:MAG TPA: TIM-barrel domain-containing protein, partial [Roseimicrobium sp.]|nr:TIM-barrel domain-containing protein [Roseimicrobium sp.]